MKRMFTASLCLFALLGAVSVSTAQTMVAAHSVSQNLSFRTTGLYATLLALDPKTQHNGGTAGYVDSVVYVRSGSAVAETTVAIQLPVAQSHQVSGAVGPDTTMLGRLIIEEAGGYYNNAGPQGILKGLDSIYVSPEVGTPNGKWSRVASLLPMVYAVADTTTGRVATYKFNNLAATSNTVTMLGLRGWTQLRFIIINDYNTATHCFRASWVSYSATDNPTK